MRRREFRDKTLLLESGKWFDLQILKIIDIPGDQPFFMARDINGLKHLIPSSYYGDYDLREGDTISCRLDRINCLGRFFFEPIHPFYKSGEAYKFKLKEFLRHSDCTNNIFSAKVIDIFGNEWETKKFLSETEPSPEIDSILCRVEAVKKAKLFLSVIDRRIDHKPSA